MKDCGIGIKIEGSGNNVDIENANFINCNKAIDISPSEIEIFFSQLKEQGVCQGEIIDFLQEIKDKTDKGKKKKIKRSKFFKYIQKAQGIEWLITHFVQVLNYIAN